MPPFCCFPPTSWLVMSPGRLKSPKSCSWFLLHWQSPGRLPGEARAGFCTSLSSSTSVFPAGNSQAWSGHSSREQKCPKPALDVAGVLSQQVGDVPSCPGRSVAFLTLLDVEVRPSIPNWRQGQECGCGRQVLVLLLGVWHCCGDSWVLDGGCGEVWMGPVPAEPPGKALRPQETNLSPSSPLPACCIHPSCPRLVFSLHQAGV